MTVLSFLLAVAAAALAGYGLGRLRPGQRIDRWAERQASGPHGARWWAAQAVMAGELACLIAAHPHRSIARLREAQRPPVRAAAPVFDPQWSRARREQGQ
jgi:hypothetical protein